MRGGGQMTMTVVPAESTPTRVDAAVMSEWGRCSTPPAYVVHRTHAEQAAFEQACAQSIGLLGEMGTFTIDALHTALMARGLSADIIDVIERKGRGIRGMYESGLLECRQRLSHEGFITEYRVPPE